MQKLAWTATLILLCGCARQGGLDKELAHLEEAVARNPATSIQKLERLNREHPGQPRILELLAHANLGLPQKNHRLAAIYFEDAAEGGATDLRLLAAQHFGTAGDTAAQVRNLCLHLQGKPGDQTGWLELGQVLIQSSEALHLELAQQILFSEKDLSPAQVQSQRADLLKLLLLEMEGSSTAWKHTETVGTGLEVVATELLPGPAEEELEEVQPVILPEEQPVGPSSEPVPLANEPAAAGLVGKFGGQGTPGVPLTTVDTATEPPEPPSPETQAEEQAAPPPQQDAQSPQSESGNNASTESQATIEDLEPKPAEDTAPTDPPDFIMEGEAALLAGDFEAAAKAYWQAARQDSDNPATWFSLSQAFYLGEEFKKAEMTALEAARRDPENPAYVVHFLRVVSETADPETYFTELKKARKLFPTEPYILLELAEQYASLDEDLRAARILYLEFLETHPEHPRKKEVELALELIGN